MKQPDLSVYLDADPCARDAGGTGTINGSNIHAIAATLQDASPSVIPAITVGGVASVQTSNVVYIYSAGHLKSGWFGGAN